MIPILYPASEKTFDTNGIGILGEIIDCTVIQNLTTGQDEFELQYPIDGLHFDAIDYWTIVMAEPAPGVVYQPYRIYRKSKPKKNIVTFYARHVAYDLIGITTSPFKASAVAASLQGLKDHATTECPFSFWTDMEVTADMSVEAPASIWSRMGNSEGAVQNIYGGEWEFDRWDVKLHGHRGADRGVSIRYGKNLTTLEQDANCADCYTGVHPFWLGSDGTLVELPEKILHAEGEYGYTRIMPLDLSQEWTEKPTEDQLRERARQYMVDNDIGTPVVSWKIEFVQLEQTEEYKDSAILERVYLGDTVSAVFPKMKLDVSARVVSTRYKPILGHYENVTLGSIRENIADTIARQRRDAQKQTTELKGFARTTATQAVAAQTAEDILSKLTNGGTVKGLYQKNGEWYIDASLVNILNVIAPTLKSSSGDTELSISQAILKMINGGNESFQLASENGTPLLALTAWANGVRSNGSQLTPSSLKLGGTSDAPAFEVDTSNGCSLRIPENGAVGTPKDISWRSNGDGTYTLIGQ